MVISLMITVVDSMINTVFSRQMLIRLENDVVLANLAVAHFFVWSLK